MGGEMSDQAEDDLPWYWPIKPQTPGQVTIRLDLWAEQQAEREAERERLRELDPFRLGHWRMEMNDGESR
jgi:hypothetical protein